jgi:TPR repeat protein
MTQRDWETAEALYGAKRFREAARIYENIAADHAYAPAQFRLGFMFSQGEGVEVDCMEAARWYTFAANQGYHSAAYNLSTLYEHGCEGLQADPQAAFRWLLKAAQSGSEIALAEVAMKWLRDKDSSRQFEAFDFASRASSQGVSEGYIALALLYREGFGVRRDNQKAMEFARKAEAAPSGLINGKARSAELLSQFYADGIGTPRDPVEALAWAIIAEARSSGDELFYRELRATREQGLSVEQREAASRVASGMESKRE